MIVKVLQTALPSTECVGHVFISWCVSNVPTKIEISDSFALPHEESIFKQNPPGIMLMSCKDARIRSDDSD